MALPQYRTAMRPGIVGGIADMTPARFISRNVEDAAGIDFGLAAFQGTDARGITSTVTTGMFVGLVTRENSVIGIGDTGNGFRQRESARLMIEGTMWVNASVAVAPRDKVYVVAATKALTNVAGTSPANIELPGWEWDTATTGANQLAIIRK